MDLLVVGLATLEDAAILARIHRASEAPSSAESIPLLFKPKHPQRAALVNESDYAAAKRKAAGLLS